MSQGPEINPNYRDSAGDNPPEAIFIALGSCQSHNTKGHLSSYSEVCDYLSILHLIPVLLFEFSESALSLWAGELGEASGIKIQQAISSLTLRQNDQLLCGSFSRESFQRGTEVNVAIV